MPQHDKTCVIDLPCCIINLINTDYRVSKVTFDVKQGNGLCLIVKDLKWDYR